MSDFDDFYDKLMGENINGESFNDIAGSSFTLQESDRVFGYIEFDGDDIWIVDKTNTTKKIKVKSLDDLYVFLAKQQLSGN
jgi:hypothetical protein